MTAGVGQSNLHPTYVNDLYKQDPSMVGGIVFGVGVLCVGALLLSCCIKTDLTYKKERIEREEKRYMEHLTLYMKAHVVTIISTAAVGIAANAMKIKVLATAIGSNFVGGIVWLPFFIACGVFNVWQQKITEMKIKLDRKKAKQKTCSIQ